MAETAANPTMAWWYCLIPLGLSPAISFPVVSQDGCAQISRSAPVGPAVLICGGNHEPSPSCTDPQRGRPQGGGGWRDRPRLFCEARAAEETGKTPKDQVPRSPPHPHSVPWSLPVHGCCTSSLQQPPGRRLRVHLISHLWPLGWDVALTGGRSWHGAHSIGSVFTS